MKVWFRPCSLSHAAFLVTLALAATTAIAQEGEQDKQCLAGAIIVTVTDKCNVPIQGASVTITGSLTAVTTDANGIAAFSTVASGAYTVRVTKAPYTAQEQVYMVGCGSVVNPVFRMVYALPSPKHKADTTYDGKISFTELSRVIQLYNAGQYYCLSGTEDGYAPGSGPRTCAPHSSDYNPQNWTISLSELNRIIQFYNQGGYYRWLGTEDGYAAVTCPR
jgi:hypothetical protein